ncbi:MAG: nucleotidyltransferase domain-containing protein [Caldiserica bacterium]|nr:MAG: nucleotidyltransferase domain-containing protein [Caldisericota bacterium]
MRGKNRVQKIVKEFEKSILDLYGRRLKRVILYGSWARREANNDSDIDLAVVLRGKVNPTKEIDRMIDIITDFNLKYGVLLSVYPVSEDNYRTLQSPLLINIRREGVSI